MSTATFTPARHRTYQARRRVRPSEALGPARGVMVALGVSSALWAGLAFLIF